MMGGGGGLKSHVAPAPPPANLEKPALPVTLPSLRVWTRESRARGPQNQLPASLEAPNPAPGHHHSSPGKADDHPVSSLGLSTRQGEGEGRWEGEGSRNQRVPSPIPESEKLVTVATNPSPPNKTQEGDGERDPGAQRGGHSQV